VDAGVIIAIVVGVLILLALFALLGKRGRDRKVESNRHEAREIRRGAEVSRAQADQTRAESDVQAAEARRQEAQARERAAEADEKHREARERHLEAARLDPDVDERQAEEQFDREHGHYGITSHGYGEADTAERDRDAEGVDDRDDERVEHYERTETADVERERHFERDDQGDVVRDDERQRPRT
jgi:F0F1-type ATP synthase membrane subunit b/b'